MLPCKTQKFLVMLNLMTLRDSVLFSYGSTAQLRLRVSAVFLPHFFSLKNEKYIQYSRVTKKPRRVCRPQAAKGF